MPPRILSDGSGLACPVRVEAMQETHHVCREGMPCAGVRADRATIKPQGAATVKVCGHLAFCWCWIPLLMLTLGVPPNVVPNASAKD